MMENGQDYGGEIEVSDDENYTDKAVKQRLQQTRQMVADAEHELFSKRLVEPEVQYRHEDAVVAYGDFVRSFIHDISVLLNHDDMEGAKYYRDEVELAEIELVPPDEYGYQFSQIQFDEVTEEQLIMQFHGFSRGATLPKPKTVDIHGLMDLAEREPVVSARWMVVKNPRAAPPNRERLTLEKQDLIPRGVYRRALAEADQFLMNCGIGLDIEAEPYQADGEPGI